MRLSAVNAANDAVDTDSSDSSWTVEDAPVESPDSQDSNTLSKREHGNLNRQAKADLAKLADEAKKEAQKSGASTALADRVEADGERKSSKTWTGHSPKNVRVIFAPKQ